MEVDYDTFGNVCLEAIEKEEVFDTFKQNWCFGYMLEQFHPGSEYFGHVFSNALVNRYKNYLNKLPWDNYKLNDSIGGPKMEERRIFEEFVKLDDYNFSHTTLRYIFTSLEILDHLKSKYGAIPDKLDIVEIGGGYGGQCKILIDTLNKLSPETIYTYTIIDLPNPSKLQRKYLDRLKVENVICSTSDNYEKNKKYDLCISMYSIGEIPLEKQDEYVKEIVINSESLYMIWNVSPIHSLIEKEVKVYKEYPEFTSTNKVVRK